MKILALLLLAVAVTARPQVGHHNVGFQNQDHFDQFRQVQADEAVQREPAEDVYVNPEEEGVDELEPERTNPRPVVAATLPARVDDRFPPQQENRYRRQAPPRVPAQPVVTPERKGSSEDASQESAEEEQPVKIQERPTRQAVAAVEVQNKPYPLPEILPEQQQEEQDFERPQVAQEFPVQPEQVRPQERFTRQTVPVAVQQPEQQQFGVQQTVQRDEIVVPQNVNPVPQQFEPQAPQHFSTQQFEQQIAQQQFEVERQQVVPEQVVPQQFGFQQVIPQQFDQPQVVFQQQEVVPQQFDVRQDPNRPQIAQEFPVEFDPATGTLVQPQQPQQPQVAIQGQEPVLQQQPQQQQQFQN